MAKKEAQEREDTDLDRGEERVYELGFHLDPDLPVEEVKKVYNEIRARIERAGRIVAEGQPLKVALAYTISRQETAGRRDFNSAHFAWIVYDAPAEAHEAIVTYAGTEKRIIRFIDLTTDHETARHAAERQELALKSPTETALEPEVDETTSENTLDAALESATV